MAASSPPPPVVVSIITPTIGSECLGEMIESLSRQSSLGTKFVVEHLIVVDNAPGVDPEKLERIRSYKPDPSPHITRHIVELPFPSCSQKNMCGHLIYASFVHFLNGEYVMYFDDDNLLEENHIEVCLEAIIGREWVYTFRIIFSSPEPGKIKWVSNIVEHPLVSKVTVKIGDQDERVYTAPTSQDEVSSSYSPSSTRRYADEVPDVFESVGQFSRPEFFVDTNCYFLTAKTARRYSHLHDPPPEWKNAISIRPYPVDRYLSAMLHRHEPNYACTHKFTVRYRVYNLPGRLSIDFFKKGRKEICERYPEGGRGSPDFPPYADIGLARPRILYIAHFDDVHTARIIKRVTFGKVESSIGCFAQWQMNMFDRTLDDLILLSAYRSDIPSGSTVLVHLCNPQTLPECLVRTDIRKILYTVESPNVRHQFQWSEGLLKFFTDVVSYWEDIPRVPGVKYHYYPFLPRLDIFNASDKLELVEIDPDVVSSRPDVCIVLENRDLRGEYSIPGSGVTLQALDYLRAEFVRALSSIGVQVHTYGPGWLGYILVPNVKVHVTAPRMEDKEKTTNFMKKHTFALILENCNAKGYVSEKIYDAWIAGSVPLYFGNFSEKLLKFFEGVDIQSMYVDISGCVSGGSVDIPTLVSILPSAEKIQEIRRSIFANREKVFERLGPASYAEFLEREIL